MKLHLGCGKRYIPGFIHVDLDKSPHIDYQHDIRRLPMFKNNSADLIYASHAFEYFDRVEATNVLKEWKRVLKPEGILRLAVPNFEALVKLYKKYGDLSLIHGPLYGRMEIASVNEKKQTIYHKTVYDFKTLKSLLESVGFINIHRYDWRKTVHKNYDDFSQAYIPHMDKKDGLLISLNVEAKKPKKIK